MAIGLAALQAARLATASAGTTGDVAWILCIGLAVTMLISALHAFQESRAR